MLRRRMMWLTSLLLACGVFLSGSAPALALSVGDRVSRQIELGGKQVPLPGGEWTLAGLGAQSFRMPAIGAFGAIRTAVLFLTSQDRVVAVLEVNSNTLPVNDGWGRTKACAGDGDQFLLIQRYRTGWETSCLFVQATHFDTTSAGPEAWEQARSFAGKSGLTLPRQWLTAGFRISDRQDLIDARYHFDPSLFLGASARTFDRTQDWSADAVKGDMLRLGAVQVVSSWAAGFDSWIERGLRNQLTDAANPLPTIATSASSAPSVDAKLAALDSMYRDGSITWAAYDAQSRKAITEVPIIQQQTSLLSNAVRKNLSFRSFGTFVDYGIAYLVTANTAVSWGIALTLNATDSVWFVLNDQYWDSYYAKLNTHDAERVVDFTYIGGGAGS